jgi:hypothetical protein
LVAPSQHHTLVGREHGRTIPLAAADDGDGIRFRLMFAALMIGTIGEG